MWFKRSVPHPQDRDQILTVRKTIFFLTEGICFFLIELICRLKPFTLKKPDILADAA